MMRKKLGTASIDEAKEISKLFSEKSALSDLVLSFARAPELGIDINQDYIYQRLVVDMQDVNNRIVDWWEKTSKVHEWSYDSSSLWMIDLKTNVVSLNIEDNK